MTAPTSVAGLAAAPSAARDDADLLGGAIVVLSAAVVVRSELAGLSAFLRDGMDVFHTYSTYARGTDLLNGTFNYLDLTALGRQEPWEEPPGRSGPPASGWWWRRHDEYAREAAT